MVSADGRVEVQSTKCLGLKEVTIFGSLVSDAVREESKDKIHVLAIVDCQVPRGPREELSSGGRLRRTGHPLTRPPVRMGPSLAQL